MSSNSIDSRPNLSIADAADTFAACVALAPVITFASVVTVRLA